MAEKSKFSGALANLNAQHKTQETPSAPVPDTTPKTATAKTQATDKVKERDDSAPPRGKGRPPGKRSDPNFQPTTVLLRAQTKKQASRLLEDRGEKKDLSALIEQLLTDWLRENS